MSVEWPDRRSDVLDGLELLAAPAPPLSEEGWDSRSWNLTEAVHAVVDDTWWDFHDPRESVGTILLDEEEAAAVADVVSAVVAVSDRQGATAKDREWFADETWPEVQRRASVALAIMRRESR